MVKELDTKDAYDEVVAESNDKLVIVDFFATWCPPCMAIKDFFAGLADTYPDGKQISRFSWFNGFLGIKTLARLAKQWKAISYAMIDQRTYVNRIRSCLKE